jgi:hypothetical protein
MSLLTDLIVRTLQTAGPATAATSAAVAACGAYEDGNPVAPINASVTLRGAMKLPNKKMRRSNTRPQARR